MRVLDVINASSKRVFGFGFLGWWLGNWVGGKFRAILNFGITDINFKSSLFLITFHRFQSEQFYLLIGVIYGNELQ
jgi:hypothetical protein